MLSHDLRSAISGVIGALQQFSPENLNADMIGHRESAIAAAREASHLLDGILDLEAIEENSFELEITEVHFGELLSDLKRRWSSRARAKDIALNIDHDNGAPVFIRVDRGRIMRVIGNVLENAIKYTRMGSVTLSARTNDMGEAVFTVADDGPGFSPEAMAQLFEFQGRPSNSAEPGSGLGLHTAKSLLDQMGGTITVRNTNGAIVEVTLPNAVVAQPEIGDLAVFPHAGTPDLSGLTILLAEDNLTNQLVVTQMLEAMGAAFDVASDGVDALAKFDTGTFDILLLDIEMPRLSGLDVMRRVRALTDARRDTTIIALTAYAMREHRARIAEAGADGMIAKPILGLEEFGNAILHHAKRASAAKGQISDAETAAQPGFVDVANFDSLANSIGPEMMEELMGKVVIDLKNVRDGIVSGLETRNLPSVQSASHILISVAGAIGASGTQHAAEKLNRAAHQSDEDKISQTAATCLTGIEEILKLVENRERL